MVGLGDHGRRAGGQGRAGREPGRTGATLGGWLKVDLILDGTAN